MHRTGHDVTDTSAIDCIVSIAGFEATVPAAAILAYTRVADGAQAHRVGTALLLDWNGSLVPVVGLATDRGTAQGDIDSGVFVVVRQPAPDGPKALLVDEVRDPDPSAGGARPPVPGMLEAYVGAELVAGEADGGHSAHEAEMFLTVEAGGKRFLLPLGDVSRIEAYPEDGLQPCGSGLAAVLSGRIMKALPLFGCVPGGRPGQALVVTSGESGQVALVVDALGEVVEPAPSPRLPWGRDGIVEARVVGGSALGVVDVGSVLSGTAMARLAA